MYTLLATIVTALVGGAYQFRAHTWDMPLWLTAPAILAPIAAAELTSYISHRRTARTSSAGRPRHAHARTTRPVKENP